MKCYKEFTVPAGKIRDLDGYLLRLEEAQKKEITENWEKRWICFTFVKRAQDQQFWHEKGWILFQRLLNT